MSELESKKVLITGSTSGIGLAIAKTFAKQNSTVILNGFGTIDEIKTIIDDLSRQTSAKVFHYGADLTDPLAIEEMMKKIQAEIGSIDILINNAGVQHVEAIETFPVNKWDQIIAINLSAYFHTTRHAVGSMKEKGWGRVINIASTHGLVGSPYKSAYVAAKHGVVGLTKVVALETGGLGVTCNAVCPGWVLTPLVDAQIKEKAEHSKQNYEEATRDFLAEKHPSLAFVEAEHIAQMCLFLCSDAASQMTGSILAIDGGWTAR